MVRVGIIGLGYWGPNYARLLTGSITGASLVACADSQVERTRSLVDQYPQVRFYNDHSQLLADGAVDAVIIATPASTHRALVEDCLRAGVGVLVEKPSASTSEDAQTIAQMADAAGLLLMVGHTFMFHPAVQRIKQYLDAGELGQVHYLYFHRTGLGPIRRDVNALWDLAPHDLAMLRYWLGTDPIHVIAGGASYLMPGREDVVFVTLRYPNNVLASIHVSWLDPVKVRRATIVGDKKMAVFDDVNVTEKLRIYDKGASYQPAGAEFGEFVTAVRDGDILIPSLPNKEPLREQVQHFIDCVVTGKRPLCDGWDGLAVVRAVEAADLSLAETRQAHTLAPL